MRAHEDEGDDAFAWTPTNGVTVMSANTRGLVGVGATSAAVEVGAEMTRMIVRQREKLPKAANGLPAACPNHRAANVLREMQGERSRHCEGLAAILFANQDQGTPDEIVVAPLLFLIEAIYARAKAPRCTRPLGAVSAIETKAQSRLDLAQLKLAESPESIEAMEDVVRAASEYAPALSELQATVNRQLAVVRTQPRATYGTGRRTAAGTLALHRA